MTPERARTVRSLALVGILCTITAGAILLALTGYFSSNGSASVSDACFYGALLAASSTVANVIVLARVPRRPPPGPTLPIARLVR